MGIIKAAFLNVTQAFQAPYWPLSSGPYSIPNPKERSTFEVSLPLAQTLTRYVELWRSCPQGKQLLSRTTVLHASASFSLRLPTPSVSREFIRLRGLVLCIEREGLTSSSRVGLRLRPLRLT